MSALIVIKDTFTEAKKKKLLKKMGLEETENLLYEVRLRNDVTFALCENGCYWDCALPVEKQEFECYEERGRFDRSAKLPVTLSLSDFTVNKGKKEKTVTTIMIKNDLTNRRFDLSFALTEDEKFSLKYFFETYFKNETISHSFKMPKVKLKRALFLKKEAFTEQFRSFFSDVKNSIKKTDSGQRKKAILSFFRKIFDWIGGLAFLCSVIFLLKRDYFTNVCGDTDLYYGFITVALCVYLIFKLITVLTLSVKASVKIVVILLILMQGVTLILLSPYMLRTPIVHRLILFFVLNTLLYFCVHILSGDAAGGTTGHYVSLLIVVILMFVAVTGAQTLELFEVPLEKFCTGFVRYLRIS